MIHHVIIGSPGHHEPWQHLQPSLANTLKGMEQICGVRAHLEEHRSEPGGVLIACRFHGPREEAPLAALCRQWVVDALAEFFVLHWEGSMVRRLVEDARDDLSPREAAAVARTALDFLTVAPPSGRRLQSLGRRAFIAQRLQDFLAENDQIHLEGFVTFRLKEYMVWLEEAVQRALDDFLLDREYREFIKVLKVFVDHQEARVGLVHVIRGPGGRGFALAHEDGEILSQDALAEMVADVAQGEIHYGDLLISALISIAPQRLLLHKPHAYLPAETVETIKGIFAGRVSTCRGCRTCRGHHSSP
ncbi:MAG TPA: putative sporulation protein YtxC [Sphingobacteriaceae bacterium]|nr:putative sporulation protein YtxC [Sphingobacteriaceae bacterium]